MPDPASLRSELLIRDASVRDLTFLRDIYAYHVLHGNASFEEEPPGTEEFQRRYETVRSHGLPYLVAEWEGAVRGYAYAAPYHQRPAYRYTVENLVYLDREAVGRGLGTALLDHLIQACTKAGLRQMVAIIGETANLASIKLHEGAGFHHVGILRSVGKAYPFASGHTRC